MSRTGFEGVSPVTLILLLITLCLIGMFIYLVSINMKYIKDISYKIQVIMRAAHENDSPLMKYKKLDKSNLNETHEDPELGAQPKNEANKKEALEVLKNMADKGRSSRFQDILRIVLEKYNHVIIWPFTRNAIYKKYDLLRPLSRFYHLLNITGVMLIWVMVVFFISIFYAYTAQVQLALVLALCILLASPCIMVFIHVYYRVYINNIKNVFSKGYKSDKYMKLDSPVKDNSIERAMPVGDSDEEQSFKKSETENKPKEEAKKMLSDSENHDNSGSFHYEGGSSDRKESDVGIDSAAPATSTAKELQSMSSRRMFSPEISDHPIYQHRIQESVSSGQSDKFLVGQGDSSEHNQSKNQFTDQVQNPPENDDYSVYEVISDDELYDAEKNHGLIENESRRKENTNSIISYTILFSILLFATGVCCILILSFPASVAAT